MVTCCYAFDQDFFQWYAVGIFLLFRPDILRRREMRTRNAGPSSILLKYYCVKGPSPPDQTAAAREDMQFGFSTRQASFEFVNKKSRIGTEFLSTFCL